MKEMEKVLANRLANWRNRVAQRTAKSRGDGAKARRHSVGEQGMVRWEMGDEVRMSRELPSTAAPPHCESLPSVGQTNGGQVSP